MIKNIEELYDHLVTELKKFFDDAGFDKAVIGASGGIDSALVAALATDALGAENVLLVTMPAAQSSTDSADDAAKLAELLGTKFKKIPISQIVDSYSITMETYAGSEYNKKGRDVTEQNIPARIRANILMAYSNKLGYLLINTCNRTEDLLGYATLYGDAIGAIAPLGEIGKMTVRELAKFRNTKGYVIPTNSIEKAPSADLEVGQTDEEDLGAPYSVLDPLTRYLDNMGDSDASIRIIRPRIPELEKYDDDFIRGIYKRMQDNAFKLEQCPPAIEIK